METLLPLDPGWVERALRHLFRGGVVALPTDTTYGLAASLEGPAGMEKIFRLKGRPPEKALPLLLPSLSRAEGLGFRFSAGAKRLALRFWPGPLTLVLKRPPSLPSWFAPGLPTAAVRVPGHGVALALLEATGWLAVTSANRSGGREALTASEVKAAFLGDKDLLVVDGGAAPGGRPSTVVDAAGESPRILRRGALSERELEEVWHGPI